MVMKLCNENKQNQWSRNRARKDRTRRKLVLPTRTKTV